MLENTKTWSVPNAMGGDQVTMRPYYRHLQKIVRNSHSLLNLGSGTTFVFEQVCHRWNPSLKIVSADLAHPQTVPQFVHAYHTTDLVKELQLPYPPFDLVTLFEVIEHVDETDALVRNAIRHCRSGGIIAVSFPNLASIYSRIELLLGYQPHILEVSNTKANFGMGIFGRLNNPHNMPIHHLRGITRRAGVDLMRHHGLSIGENLGGSGDRLDRLWSLFPSIAPVTLLLCTQP